MKPSPKPHRANTEDSLGLGIEVAVILVLFFGLGVLFDNLAGTTPVFMIVMFLLGAIGLFAKFKYRYDDRMNEHETERQQRAGQRADAATPTAIASTNAAVNTATSGAATPQPHVARPAKPEVA